jgi:signal transduction histidine kinase
LGLAILGGSILAFFRSLAFDIDRVRDRAVAIVSGYRAQPLEHQRSDEVGALMDAINKMQQELRQREAEIEVARMQHFHKEKMAAVGSLAAAIAHEINNPMSAIVGVAQAMEEQCDTHGCQQFRDNCHPDMILEQAKRVMQITRRISEFAIPQSPDPELLDINGLLRNTCNFVAFDRRFRLIELATDLDSNLPAVVGTADHLVQVAMNLLINAADSLEGQSRPAPRIVVRTRQKETSMLIEFIDNGAGIAPENLELVFEEHFTTKEPGRGSGLGLAVCRSLIREAGGDILIASRLMEGTTVTVRLPIPGTEGDGERHAA